MDLRPILGLISFLQQEEDEEDEDILAILSIIKVTLKKKCLLDVNSRFQFSSVKKTEILHIRCLYC